MSQFEPKSMKLSELLEQINNGELKLPSFQRSYRWKPSKVKRLLDSLQKNHPAGSLLLLQVDSKKCVVEQDNFKFADEAEQEAEYLVLDGQQRLTSCYCAFYNKGNRSYYLDLRRLYNEVKYLGEDELIDFETLIIVKNQEIQPDKYLYDKDLLPLSFLKNKDIMREKLRSYKENLRQKKENDEYVYFLEVKLEKFLDPFFDYSFPAIVLPKKLSLEAICKVFQTINTTGLKLSAFDICVAKFMASKRNLKDMLKQAYQEYDNLEVVLNKDETIVLQTIALLVDKTPKKNKLADTLSERDLEQWDKAIKGISCAIDLLEKFGAGCKRDLSIIPYQPVIPVIASVLVNRDYCSLKLPNQANIEHKLRIYFYTSALKQRYTEGTDNKIKEDYNNLIKWIGTEIVPTEIEDGVQWNSSKMIRLNKGGAIGKAVLCAINYNQPKDFYTDTQTGVGEKSEISQLHHVFPQKQYEKKYHEQINSVFNYTFLTPASNNYIKDKETIKYITGIMEDLQITQDEVEIKLSKHFINKETFNAMLQERYIDFLVSRADEVCNFFEGIGVTMVRTKDALAEEIECDDDFELTDEEE